MPVILCSSLQASVASYLIFKSFSFYFLVCISAKSCPGILGGVESVACCAKEQDRVCEAFETEGAYKTVDWNICAWTNL